jgi:hypothetical protein
MGTIIVNIKYCEFSGSRGGEYKVYSFWVLTPRSYVEVDWRFRGA